MGADRIWQLIGSTMMSVHGHDLGLGLAHLREAQVAAGA